MKILAAVLGVIAASVPVLVFNVWLRNQGHDEAAVTAAWTLGYAETQIGQAVAAVSDLSAKGLDACQPAQIEAMRRTVLLTGPIKQVMLIGQDGEIACTNSGVQTRQHIIDSAVTPDRDIMFELVRMGDDAGERMLRIRKVVQTDKPGIAAVVPAGLLLPQVSIQGGPLRGAIRLTMPGGALVGEAGEDAVREQHHASLRSRPYGLRVAVSMPAAGLIVEQDGLRRIAMLVTGMIAIAILLFALMRVRRQSGGTAANLARAILAEEFVPYYQPVVDIRTGKLLGAEVLVCWKRADGGFIEPAAFVALVGSSGPVLELTLTRSLMRRVRDDIGPAIGKRPHLTIAFKVAPQHFDDAGIINDVGTIFDRSQIKLTQIVLELTGRHRIDNLIGMRRTVAALQGMGCKVAIDDAGAGHGGLSYILKLGVDIIKIDRTFVQSLDSEGHCKIIETLIDLAKNMRMEIVAGGVENFDQVMYLRQHGVAAAQGYVFAPPLPSGSFLQLLDAMDSAGDIAGPAVAKADRTRSKVAPPTTGKWPPSLAAAAKPAQANRVR